MANDGHTHDVAVIGKGMIGSASARHLADQGIDVVLVGPDEPVSYSDVGPFSSHFDQGRVTRICAFDERWSDWAAASIERYAELAQRSGIFFHDPVGLVVLSRDSRDALAAGLRNGADSHTITLDQLAQRTGIVADGRHGHEAIWEGPPAGVINPRQLVEAQTICATQSGATVVRHAVESVDSDGPVAQLRGSFGEISAEKVILATGAYGAQLVDVDLPIERRLRTIVLADVGDGPELPTLIIEDPPHDLLEEAYWVPPVMYPNGRVLLKIGGDSVPKVTAKVNADIDEWFNNGASEHEAAALLELLRQLLPQRSVEAVDWRPCVVTYTNSGLPLIEMIKPNIAVALGGCGAAAKSSDELGRIAAQTVLQG